MEAQDQPPVKKKNLVGGGDCGFSQQSCCESHVSEWPGRRSADYSLQESGEHTALDLEPGPEEIHGSNAHHAQKEGSAPTDSNWNTHSKAALLDFKVELDADSLSGGKHHQALGTSSVASVWHGKDSLSMALHMFPRLESVGKPSVNVKQEPDTSDYDHSLGTLSHHEAKKDNVTKQTCKQFPSHAADVDIKLEPEEMVHWKANSYQDVTRNTARDSLVSVPGPSEGLSHSSEDEEGEALPVHFDGERDSNGDKLYQCGTCGQAYAVASELSQHMELHEMGEKSYCCGGCGKVFSHFSLLTRHAVVHTQDKFYKCDHCQASFSRLDYLIKHVSKHPGVEVHPCDECAQVFLDGQTLQRHVVRRHGEGRCYKCEVCSSTFKRVSNLNSHLKTHMTVKPFACDQCDASFARLTTLKIHKGVHSTERPYQCHLCPSTFTDPSGLKRHLTYHLEEKQHTCEVCSSKFRTASHLKSHMRTHSSEKPFSCAQCSSSFKYPAALKAHMHRHSKVKAFKCAECGVEYWTSSGLQKHKLVHTGEKPFRCELCPRAYRQNSALKIHMLCHQGEKPCQCPHCPARYRTSSKLKQHIRVHTHDEPFKCPYCSASFAKAFLLGQHAKFHHVENADVEADVVSSPTSDLAPVMSNDSIQTIQTVPENLSLQAHDLPLAGNLDGNPAVDSIMKNNSS